MAHSSKQRVGQFVPTRTSGIYSRAKADGTKTFYARYTDSTGKRRYEKAGTFEQAKALYADRVGKHDQGRGRGRHVGHARLAARGLAGAP